MVPQDRVQGWGERIREARKNARLSQKALAEMIGRSQSTVNDWEHGHTEPSVKYFELIARATGQPAGWLAFGKSEPAPGAAAA